MSQHTPRRPDALASIVFLAAVGTHALTAYASHRALRHTRQTLQALTAALPGAIDHTRWPDYLAHELRTHLTVVKGHAERLRRHPEQVTLSAAAIVATTQRIETAADRLLDLLGDTDTMSGRRHSGTVGARGPRLVALPPEEQSDG